MIGESLVSSTDGSRIFYNDGGLLGYIDTASGLVYIVNNASYLGSSGYEIEISADQKRLLADGFVVDMNLNTIGMQVLNTAESFDAAYVYGGAFSANGGLFFQPGLQAIDIFDGVTGSFRARVALPMPLSSNFRALVPNNKDNRIIAITGSGDGLAVIDLSSILEPASVPWLSAVPAPAITGNAQVRVTANQGRPQSPLQTVHRRLSPLLRGLSHPHQ
jgi:hypothetical protein